MVRTERRAGRIFLEAMAVPTLVVRVIDKLFQPEVDGLQLSGLQFAVNNHTGSGPAALTPLIAVFVGGIVSIRIVPDPNVDHAGGARAGLPVHGIAFVEELGNVVPDCDHLFRVIEKLGQTLIVQIERTEIDRGADAARHDGFGVRIFSAQNHISLAGHAGHMQSFAVQFANQRVEIGHQSAHGAITMHGSARRLGLFRFLPDLRIGAFHHLRGIVGPC